MYKLKLFSDFRTFHRLQSISVKIRNNFKRKIRSNLLILLIHRLAFLLAPGPLQKPGQQSIPKQQISERIFDKKM